MTMPNHPLRAALSEEMHLRRLPRLAAPCRLVQIVTVLDEATADAARDHIDMLAIDGRSIVPLASKYGVLALGGMTLVWERHTEFATYTLLRPGAFDAPFDPHWFDPVLPLVLSDMPGAIIRATQIAVMRDADAAAIDVESWCSPEATILCDVADGSARIVSDFRLNEDGYGRLLVIDRGLERDEPAQLVLRLQELGNYRNMALLGLPLAQRLSPSVTMLEARLAHLTQAVSERTSQDDQLLDELTFLSAQLAQLVAETRYRVSATRAYAQLSAERLASLCIGAVRGYQTLADFTERRLAPAVRTCDSFSARLEDLSQRAARTSELLRTRIDIALSKQNRDLLLSMDARARVQLRLQQTVEGLSVVAISYYLVALVGYLLSAVPGVEHQIAVAATVPLVVAVVAFGRWRLHRHIGR
ncbi:DUF3422 domain-containing protein [Sphingomonas ginsenosidivorax]|uniref:DUF3422 domain-containing protein n=1 Tax=Sphingomonas ginsenosidivorax TaxID=862135 RepID=A0A5C6UEE4_9SPHN|nr:DUF3422 domain-containing protein [Sphingomonas ginsenosidivorax]TXC71177.1 DUF3422 domain-containing protein [Sphingomonas ginsenosidivorax]